MDNRRDWSELEVADRWSEEYALIIAERLSYKGKARGEWQWYTWTHWGPPEFHNAVNGEGYTELTRNPPRIIIDGNLPESEIIRQRLYEDVEDARRRMVEEGTNFYLCCQKGARGKQYCAIINHAIPEETLQTIVDDQQARLAEAIRIENMSPEEHEAYVQDLLRQLSGSPGFAVVNLPVDD